MIKRILITTIVLIIIALIIFWFATGGAARAWRMGQNFTNPIDVIFGNGTTTGILIRLPWQPAERTRGPDISAYAGEADRLNQNADTGSSDERAVQVRTFGNPSPYAGKITIGVNNATADNAEAEYVEIDAASDNTEPIDVSGWSLQSAVSGFRLPIPQAAPVFIAGTVNNVEHVYLAPGQSAIITTGTTPVGTSFRETICTGYLEQLQTFTPALTNTCPDPLTTLPQTAQNVRAYGSACFDYLSTLPRCYFPQNMPSNLSSACRQFVANTMSYNGCVNRYRTSPSFALPSWRLYLNMRAELWYNTHDVIRLLDEEGRTVDVLTY